MQNEKPSNTREQCAFDGGKLCAERMARGGTTKPHKNPHSKQRDPVQHHWWQKGFDSVQVVL